MIRRVSVGRGLEHAPSQGFLCIRGQASPAWAAEVTGVPADRIVALARAYATTRPAMIVLGGSSMHKGPNGWQAARAIGCLPALTGDLGIPGGGLGPRHGGATHGQGLASIVALDRRPPGRYIPSQMSSVLDALNDGHLRVLLLFGTDMMSSFADSGRLARGLARQDLVASYELFMNGHHAPVRRRGAARHRLARGAWGASAPIPTST